jgi:hypothetical protein
MVRIIPDIGVFQLTIDLLQAFEFARQVKDTP